jgi:hypothetical protein
MTRVFAVFAVFAISLLTVPVGSADSMPMPDCDNHCPLTAN